MRSVVRVHLSPLVLGKAREADRSRPYLENRILKESNRKKRRDIRGIIEVEEGSESGNGSGNDEKKETKKQQEKKDCVRHNAICRKQRG